MEDEELQQTETEIIRRLESFDNPEVTNLLYEFGSMLVREEVAREERIDSKAWTLAGFAGAILTLMATTFGLWAREAAHQVPTVVLMVVGVLCLLAGAFLSTRAFGVRTFQWFDEKDTWFADSYFESADRLKKYYLVAMYRVVASHSGRNEAKIGNLQWAERLVKVGAIVIIVTSVATLVVRLLEKGA